MKTQLRFKYVILFIVIALACLIAFVNFQSEPLAEGIHADRVEVYKSKRILELWQANQKLKEYRISLGHNPTGAKVQEGDSRTPEGTFHIDFRNATSRFHLSLHISYPNAFAIEQARAHKVAPGGAIMIHGLQNGLSWIGRVHQLVDWTDGCIAVTNPEIEEIWRAIPDGTPINIHP